MSARRPVRVDPYFFRQLDALFDRERGAAGTPSSADFIRLELPQIVEHFATGFDQMAEPIPGRPDYRTMLVVGILVPRIAVTGQLMPDGAVSLLTLRIDTEATW